MECDREEESGADTVEVVVEVEIVELFEHSACGVEDQHAGLYVQSGCGFVKVHGDQFLTSSGYVEAVPT